MTKLRSLVISKSKAAYVTPSKRTNATIDWRQLWIDICKHYNTRSIDYIVDVDIRHVIKRKINKQLKGQK